jgi:hypothetical protein
MVEQHHPGFFGPLKVEHKGRNQPQRFAVMVHQSFR